MTTANDQDKYTSERLQRESRDKRIAELEAAVARHERANGRLAAELQEARDECAMHHADVLRLEALVERHGLNAAPGREADPVVQLSELRALVKALDNKACELRGQHGEGAERRWYTADGIGCASADLVALIGRLDGKANELARGRLRQG
jgi:hypothetical protein